MAEEFKPESGMDRQEMLRAAIYFLQNPQLLSSPLSSKRQFLLDKGLSQEEIEDAINMALSNAARTQNHSHGSSRWNFVFILGLCYGAYSLYNLYRTYLETKRLQQKKPIEKIQDKPACSLSDIMARMLDIQRTIELQKSGLSTEIQSIKSLLLSHNQFTAPPTIPAWQLEDDEPETSSNKPEQPIAPNLA